MDELLRHAQRPRLTVVWRRRTRKEGSAASLAASRDRCRPGGTRRSRKEILAESVKHWGGDEFQASVHSVPKKCALFPAALRPTPCQNAPLGDFAVDLEAVIANEPNSLQRGESRGDRRIALGASELSSQLRERNISKSLHGLSNVDLPRAIALAPSAKRAEHIPSMAKEREQHFVEHGCRIACVPVRAQSPAVVVSGGHLFHRFSLLATRG